MMLSKRINKDRLAMYRLLSRVFLREADTALMTGLRKLAFPKLDDGSLLQTGYELLKEYLSADHENEIEELCGEFAGLFLASGIAQGRAAIPAESLYTGGRDRFMGEAWEAVSEIYKKSGLTKTETAGDLMEDSLSLELDYMAWLLENRNQEEMQIFLAEHLLNWVPEFAEDVAKYSESGFYRAFAEITLGFLEQERELMENWKTAPSYSVRRERMADVIARLRSEYSLVTPGDDGGLLEVSELEDIKKGEGGHLSPNSLETIEGAAVLFVPAAELRVLHKAANETAGRKLKLIVLEPDGGADLAGVSGAVAIDDICALIEIYDEALLPYFENEVPANFYPGIFDGR